MRSTSALLLALAFSGSATAADLPQPGETARALALDDLAGDLHDVSTREGVGPTILVFFRGAW